MKNKLQYNLYKTLYRLFSWLADKSGGWNIFVQPKVIIGSLILGLGFIPAVYGQSSNEKQTKDSVPTQNPQKENIYEASEPFCYTAYDPQTEFKGGTEKMFEFLKQNLHYPHKLIKSKIEGMVVTSFTIKKDGSLENIKVIRGLHPLLDKEAIRLISIMPNWVPPTLMGKSTEIQYTLPIRFKCPDHR